MWEPVRGDIRKRHLQIDGPTRLIRIHEDKNEGLKRFRGTQVKLHITRTDKNSAREVVSWKAVDRYIRNICQELPYRVNLRHVTESVTEVEFVDARPLEVPVSPAYADHTYRIPLRDRGGLIEGELAIVPYPSLRQTERELFDKARITVRDDLRIEESVLLRGGFGIGEVPGTPKTYGVEGPHVGARVRLEWGSRTNVRHIQTNLARTAPAEGSTIAWTVFETWMRYLLDHRSELIPGFIWGLDVPSFRELGLARTSQNELSAADWLEEYDAYSLYELARNGWQYRLYDHRNKIDRVQLWEQGKDAVPIIDIYLQYSILQLILPRVAPELYMDHEGNPHVCPPVQDWQDILKSWRTFVSQPVRWSKVGKYAGRVESLLWLFSGRSPKFFNAKYADGLSRFTDEELDSLSEIFYSATSAHSESRPLVLNENAALLLQRAVDTFGDVSIRSFSKTCSLAAFAWKTSSTTTAS
jgi:hypothetical protein